jgi:predicted metal-binding protein
LPFIDVPREKIIFDPKVQTYCINSIFKCPNYSHSWACPPEAPYLEKEISNYKKFFLIYIKVDLISYIEKQRIKYPKKSEKKIRNALLMDNLLRDRLEKEILTFIENPPIIFKEKLVLWDGFCRVCYNEKDKGCTYDKGVTCRYPDRIRYSMEAVGIDVTKTVKGLNFNIEWPPINYIFRFGLICLK